MARLYSSYIIQVKKALDDNPEVKLLFLCSPGNPTGSRLASHDIVSLLEYPSYQGLVVVDEAYVDFVSCGDEDASVASWVLKYPNLVVLQTLSKSFGLAGIRYAFWRIYVGALDLY